MADESGAEAGGQVRIFPPTPLRRLKSIVGGSAGNLVEWYDWFAYSSFTLYFAPIFFPKGDTTAQLLQAAAVFAIGFLMRPLGAWLMGLYADRKGRKAALSLSVVLMCAGSLIIAVTPGYAAIGVAAPAILLLARMLQGLSVGGEYGASATYLSEVASRHRRGFWASFQYVTLIGGQLIALAVLILLQRTMPAEDLTAWGWRIPFVIGAVLAVVVFWIRMGIEETPSYRNAELAGAKRATTMLLFLEHPREAWAVMGLTAAGSLTFYALTTYMQKFLVNTSGFSKDQATEITAGALICFMLAQPLFGWLSDRWGRKPMLLAFGILGMLVTYPLFTAISATDNPWEAFGLVLIGLLVLSSYTSISGLIKAELFPTHVRALGVALPYAIANALFGGTAEYVALWFKSEGHETWFYWYVTGVIGVFLITAALLRDMGKHSAIRED